MRGLRIAAVAVTLAAGAFVAARGCGERDGTSTTGNAPRAEDHDPATAGAGEANGVAGRARAARPVGDTPGVAAAKPSDRPLKLVVQVWASPEGTPIEGATILLPDLAGRPEGVTDASGRTSLDVPAGQHLVHVRSPGRTTAPRHVVCREATTVLPVELPAGARLEGRVTEAGTGRPLAGVKLALFDGGWVEGTWWPMPGKPFADLVSDEAGAFGIDGLATGRPVTLQSTFPGRARNRTTLFVAESGVLRAEIAMEPGGSVTGVVRRADGTPFPGVVVSVGAVIPSGARFPGHARLFAPTGADGTYRVEGLDLDGVYVVECYASPSASAAATGARPTSALPEVRCDLTFAPTGVFRVELSGTRADEDDSVHVYTVLSGMHDTEVGWVWEGDSRELTPRRLRVEWNPEDGHPPIVREVEIESGVETVVRIERPPVHRVVGRVVDANGIPAVSFDVSLTRFVGVEAESPDLTLLEDGNFEIADVAAGPWTLEAEFRDRPTVRREIVVPCEPLVVVAPAATSLRFRLPEGLDDAFVRWAVEAQVADPGGEFRWDQWSSGSGPADGEPFVDGPADWTGPTRLRANVSGFLPFERILDVQPGSHHDVVAEPLVPCGTLGGRVVDRHGRPVSKASVSFADGRGDDALRDAVLSEGDGKFANLTLPPGTGSRTILVTAGGFAVRRIDFAGDVPNPLEIVLSHPGRLLVRARDSADAPAVAREVRVLDAAGRAVDLAPSAFTDHRGRAEYRVPPGRLRVTVGGGESVAVDVAEEGTATIDVVVP